MTKYYELTGELFWANNLLSVDDKFKNRDGSGFYKAVVKLDDAGKETLAQSCVTVKPDKKGNETYTFRRPDYKTIKGERVDFGAPKIHGVPEGVLIGNGSRVSVRISAYQTQMGMGHRLEDVTVTNLVVYTPDNPGVDNTPPAF